MLFNVCLFVDMDVFLYPSLRICIRLQEKVCICKCVFNVSDMFALHSTDIVHYFQMAINTLRLLSVYNQDSSIG